MQHFSSGSVDIAFLDEGQGEPVLLIHGFASTASVNWIGTSWTESLKRAGYRVIAFDNRGHGESAKLYDPSDYRPAMMARDARNLLSHLAIAHVDVIGYSLGGRIAAFLALDRPGAVRSLVIGGIGLALVDGMPGSEEIARALEAPATAAIPDGPPAGYRTFAERNGGDLAALAACMRGSRETIPAERLASIRCPTLVAVGERDEVSGSGEALARLIANAEFLPIPRRDHMLATGDKVFKNGVVEFLARRP